jgi:hypothetical protein
MKYIYSEQFGQNHHAGKHNKIWFYQKNRFCSDLQDVPVFGLEIILVYMLVLEFRIQNVTGYRKFANNGVWGKLKF